MRLVALIFAGALTFCALGAPAVASNAEVFALGSTTIEFAPRSGSCRLNPHNSDVENAYFQMMNEVQAGRNRVMAIYIGCDELLKFRNSTLENFSQWSQLFTTLHKGREEPVRGYTRYEFISGLQGAFDKGLSIDARDVGKKLEDVLSNNFAGELLSVDTSFLQEPVLIGKDDVGLYLAIVMEVRMDGYDKVVAGVVGMTMVNLYQVQYAAYKEFVDAGTFADLQLEVRESLHSLIQTNESLDDRLRSLPQNFERVESSWHGLSGRLGNALSMGIVGAVVGAFFVLLRFAWRKIRGTNSES